jgi:hypothetical protein
MPAKDESDASDWGCCQDAVAQACQAPPLQIAPIKRHGWKPVLAGNKSLSVGSISIDSIGSVGVRSAVAANHPIGQGNGTAQNWAGSVTSQIIVKD